MITFLDYKSTFCKCEDALALCGDFISTLQCTINAEEEKIHTLKNARGIFLDF